MTKLVLINFVLAFLLTGEQSLHADETNNQEHISIAVLMDISGSAELFGIPKVSYQDIEPIIKYIEAHTGTLTIGLISAFSDRNNLSISLYHSSNGIAPVKSDYPNVFAYRKAKKAYKNKQAKQKVNKLAFNKRNKAKIEKFKKLYNKFINQKISSDATDIENALNRTFYSHKLASKSGNFKAYTILLSDGVSNVENQLLDDYTSIPIKHFIIGGSLHSSGDWEDKIKPIHLQSFDQVLNLLGINY